MVIPFLPMTTFNFSFLTTGSQTILGRLIHEGAEWWSQLHEDMGYPDGTLFS